MLNFDSLTSTSEVTFNFFNLGANHHKIFIRFNAYASCSGHNEGLIYTLGGVSTTIATVSTQIIY